MNKGLKLSFLASKYLCKDSTAESDRKTFLSFPPFPTIENSRLSKLIVSQFKFANSETRSPVEKRVSKIARSRNPSTLPVLGELRICCNSLSDKIFKGLASVSPSSTFSGEREEIS